MHHTTTAEVGKLHQLTLLDDDPRQVSSSTPGPQRRPGKPRAFSATSSAAAEAALPKLNDRKRLILSTAALIGGLTREEMAKACGMLLQSVCSPVLELIKAGLLVESGERPTESGTPAAILVLTDLGRRATA